MSILVPAGIRVISNYNTNILPYYDTEHDNLLQQNLESLYHTCIEIAEYKALTFSRKNNYLLIECKQVKTELIKFNVMVLSKLNVICTVQ